MIQILIVDDNVVRRDQTCSLLLKAGVAEEGILCVASSIEAKRALAKLQYDVLLLDLVLPDQDRSVPKRDEGIRLLQEISVLENYKMPRKIFLISEFDDVIQDLQDITKKLSCTVIKYDPAGAEWKIRLTNYMEQILRSNMEQARSYGVDAAIICALETPELTEIKRLPFDWEPYNVPGDSTDYFQGTFLDKKLICAASYEMGLSSAAILSTKIISTFRPKYLIMTGIAGGVDKEKLHFGDVMLADPCFDYESGKRIFKSNESIFMPDYRQIRLDNSIMQIIRRLSTQQDKLDKIKNECDYEKPNEQLQLKIGPFGSGAAVLSDKTVIDRVKQHNRKFLGFDMEAYAVMLSGTISTEPRVTPIVIKAVSDFGDGKIDKYQKYASYTSAKVLQWFLEELWG